MSKTNTPPVKDKCPAEFCAGIDVSKAWLDVAVLNSTQRFANTADGHAAMIGEFRRRTIRRAGLEATGGYEQDAVQALRAAGFDVHVFQPKQVRAYAVFRMQRAKTDRIDAQLIARATCELEGTREPPDGRLLGFSAILTHIDQIVEDLTRTKTRTEHVKDPVIRGHHASEIKRLRAAKRKAYARLAAEVRAHDDLREKLELIQSIDGIGEATALALLVRMPELGHISREQTASLVGAAPVTRQSGNSAQESHIEGGRMRVRTALFACTQAAIKWNAELKAFYARLMKNGKHHRVAIIACARKLAIFVNTVLTRKTKWQSQPAKQT